HGQSRQGELATCCCHYALRMVQSIFAPLETARSTPSLPSRAAYSRNSATEPDTETSSPCARNLFFSSGSAMILVVAANSLSMISGGVLDGANSPYQADRS